MFRRLTARRGYVICITVRSVFRIFWSYIQKGSCGFECLSSCGRKMPLRKAFDQMGRSLSPESVCRREVRTGGIQDALWGGAWENEHPKNLRRLSRVSNQHFLCIGSSGGSRHRMLRSREIRSRHGVFRSFPSRFSGCVKLLLSVPAFYGILSPERF